MDITEEVPNTPTTWVSPLIVAPKPDGDIRVCVDMRRANEAIVRERHPIPTIEEILYDLNGSTVFNKIDLKWGFHLIELEESSREITTYTTHRGLYRYKRLMFGISSARIERCLRLQCYNYHVVYRPGRTNIADALSRLNQPNPKDTNTEKEDLVRFVAQQSTPVSLTPKEIERASKNDPELSSVRHYFHTGDWSQCKMPGYASLKNELCTMGKMVLRGDRIVIPQSLRKMVLKLAHEGHQEIVKVEIMRSTVASKIIAALTEIFARFGYPYSLKTDNGPQFVSNEFTKFLR